MTKKPTALIFEKLEDACAALSDNTSRRIYSVRLTEDDQQHFVGAISGLQAVSAVSESQGGSAAIVTARDQLLAMRKALATQDKAE